MKITIIIMIVLSALLITSNAVWFGIFQTQKTIIVKKNNEIFILKEGLNLTEQSYKDIQKEFEAKKVINEKQEALLKKYKEKMNAGVNKDLSSKVPEENNKDENFKTEVELWKELNDF